MLGSSMPYLRQPQMVRIAGQAVQIANSGKLRGQGCAGTFEFQESEILLDSGMADESKKSTAVHEVVHGLDAAAGSSMKERDVCAFASLLFTFIRDNPEFVAWVAQDSVTQR